MLPCVSFFLIISLIFSFVYFPFSLKIVFFVGSLFLTAAATYFLTLMLFPFHVFSSSFSPWILNISLLPEQSCFDYCCHLHVYHWCYSRFLFFSHHFVIGCLTFISFLSSLVLIILAIYTFIVDAVSVYCVFLSFI